MENNISFFVAHCWINQLESGMSRMFGAVEQKIHCYHYALKQMTVILH